MIRLAALIALLTAWPAFGQCLSAPSIVNEITVAGTTPTCGYPSYRCTAGETITLKIEHTAPPDACFAYYWRQNKGSWARTTVPELVVETPLFYDHNEQHRWEAYAENTTTQERSLIATAFYDLVKAQCAPQDGAIAVTIQFLGARSGCTETNGQVCYRAEHVTFTAIPAPPYVTQPCDRFTWSFQDGSGVGYGPTTTHQYETDGEYPVSVQMIDNSSNRLIGTTMVKVSGPSPTGGRRRRGVRS